MPQITLHPSEHEFESEPGESILAAAERVGIRLPFECKDGSCGMCAAKLVAGSVDQRRAKPFGLTPQMRAEGYVLTCVAIPQEDVVLDLPLQVPFTEARATVVAKNRQTHDTIELVLQLPPEGHFEYEAGQYAQLTIPDTPVSRAYSMAAPFREDGRLSFFIRKVPDGQMTGYIFDVLEEGMALDVCGPMGSFGLVPDSERPMLMVAGGSGMAPIQALLMALFTQNDPRPTLFYYGARTQADLYRLDWLNDMATVHSNFEFVPVLSHEPEDSGWGGRRGFVTDAVLEDQPDLTPFEAYLCGPPPMIEAAVAGFSAQGLDAERIRFDAF
ncbi:MAG: CDP-6-deoxy-delta-3,4-glucoseen reductase [Alphaproteobacteria bacterium CG_4_10_14_0_2_um_filter_63_37]|nr:MAG: hypothetical protein AUJ55_10120 [Proteobacteria bacterium CG1_02_64_396]PJA24220.1 MAG: CDP-6-deoxy-delta-3,4-glucoseen reductase [Alphaproteobacteria bacterium CG_4_10_14_0_2_um_filter_63_37]